MSPEEPRPEVIAEAPGQSIAGKSSAIAALAASRSMKPTCAMRTERFIARSMFPCNNRQYLRFRSTPSRNLRTRRRSPPPVANHEASPGLAFVLGLIPGVGAIYNGQYAKGLVHVIIIGLTISILSNGAARGFEPLLSLLLAAFFAYMAFEAYHTAQRPPAGPGGRRILEPVPDSRRRP